MQNRTCARAFTLIELLIVVAIIAILAAIAVPNFLEAQTRSKVSRVKSDQRALAMAIEAYTLDNDRPPIDSNYGYQVLTLWTGTTRDNAFNSLTTPIAYITSIPIDPFASAPQRNVGGQLLYEKSFRYLCMLDTSSLPYRLEAYAKGFIWFVHGQGPSRDNSRPWVTDMIVTRDPAKIYDPTNGTVSVGYIARCNKGEFTAQLL